MREQELEYNSTHMARWEWLENLIIWEMRNPVLGLWGCRLILRREFQTT